jgi:hypothetical protein
MNGEMNYDSVLAWLEAKRTALDQAIAGVRALMGLEQQASGGTPTMTVRATSAEDIQPGTFLSMSITDATKKFLNLVKCPQTTTEIAEALRRGGLHSTSKDYTTNVYTILARHEKQVGEIVRVEKRWGLVEWFPNYRRRTTAKETPKEEPQKKQVDELKKKSLLRVRLTSQNPPPVPPDVSATTDRITNATRANGGDSLRDHIKMVLRDAGAPLPTEEIIKRVSATGFQFKPLVLKASLRAMVKENRGVYRHGEGSYGLAST